MHGGPTCIGKFLRKLPIVFRVQILVRTSKLSSLNLSGIHVNYVRTPNEEFRIDFGGPILNEKDKEIYFLTCIDRYSNFPTVEIFEKVNGPMSLNFFENMNIIMGFRKR